MTSPHHFIACSWICKNCVLVRRWRSHRLTDVTTAQLVVLGRLVYQPCLVWGQSSLQMLHTTFVNCIVINHTSTVAAAANKIHVPASAAVYAAKPQLPCFMRLTSQLHFGLDNRCICKHLAYGCQFTLKIDLRVYGWFAERLCCCVSVTPCLWVSSSLLLNVFVFLCSGFFCCAAHVLFCGIWCK